MSMLQVSVESLRRLWPSYFGKHKSVKTIETALTLTWRKHVPQLISLWYILSQSVLRSMFTAKVFKTLERCRIRHERRAILELFFFIEDLYYFLHLHLENWDKLFIFVIKCLPWRKVLDHYMVIVWDRMNPPLRSSQITIVLAPFWAQNSLSQFFCCY